MGGAYNLGSAVGADYDILVVDDDDDVLSLMVEALRLKGYSVLAAPDASAALELLTDGSRARLYLVDLCMPGVDGLGFLSQATQLTRSPDAQVLICTGSPQARQPPDGMPVLLKPFDLVELHDRVRALIGEAPRGARRGAAS
jgi:CheY-like chemotaxis protein